MVELCDFMFISTGLPLSIFSVYVTAQTFTRENIVFIFDWYFYFCFMKKLSAETQKSQ